MTATRYVIHVHGYGAYTAGCRCDTCKAAKRAYVNERRREARSNPADRSGEDFEHGTRFGYEERGCRCEKCDDLKHAYWRQERSVRHRRERPGSRCDICGYRYARCTCPAPLAGRPAGMVTA